jgi:carboxymethylenebutenolidase
MAAMPAFALPTAIGVLALAAASGARAASAPGLPPGEAGARAALEASPRHGEYVDVPVPDGRRLRAYVVYPEARARAPVVIVNVEG